MFSLSEKIFLLALLEKKDSIRLTASLSLPFAIAGATLMEMVFGGFARVVDGKLTLLPEANGVERERIRNVVEKIASINKSKKLDYWIYLFGSRGNRLSKSILLSLIDKGILLNDGKAYHWGDQNYMDGQPVWVTKYLLKRQLRDAVFCGKADDVDTPLVLGLMDSCGLLDHIFTRDEIIAARKMVKRLEKEAVGSQPYRDLLSQTQTAIAYAVAAAISV